MEEIKEVKDAFSKGLFGTRSTYKYEKGRDEGDLKAKVDTPKQSRSERKDQKAAQNLAHQQQTAFTQDLQSNPAFQSKTTPPPLPPRRPIA